MKKWMILLLVGLLLVQLQPRASSAPQFEVLPIFTPVSLQYEAEIHQGEEPVDIRKLLQILPELEQKLEGSEVSKEDLLRLNEQRQRMLQLRNRRHELNIAMMEGAISVLSELNEEQWAFIQSNRDRMQAEIEADIMERLLHRLD